MFLFFVQEKTTPTKQVICVTLQWSFTLHTIDEKSGPQSKNAASIKHSRYFYLMSNFSPIHFLKRFYVYRICFIVTEEDWSSAKHFRNFPKQKRKYSACDLKCRYCVFNLWGRNGHETKVDQECYTMHNQQTMGKVLWRPFQKWRF